MRRFWIVLPVLMLAVGWAVPQDIQDDPSLLVDREVSRTAIYPGDVFEYRVSVLHSNEFAFVTEDLEDRLSVRPFELLNFQFEQTNLGEETLLEMVLELVCYEDPGLLEIPSFDLFYYPRDVLSEGAETPQQDVPARAITVPAHRIQLQSTLLGEGDQLRDTTVLLSFPRSEFILPVLSGVILLAMVAGFCVVAVRYAIQRRQVEGMGDQVRLQEEALESIREVQQKGTSQQDPALYLELSKLIRQYLYAACGFFSAALTPEEIRQVLETNTSDGDFARRVEDLLNVCDCRFFDPGKAARPDFPDVCQQAESLVKSTPFEA